MSRSPKKRINRERRKLRKHERQFPELTQLPEQNSPPQIHRRQFKPVEALNEPQGHLICEIRNKDITYITGPAGTGKTYIAASIAAEMLIDKEISSIVITRPMIGCGEDMGFLPGELDEKYEPWVQPVFDVLREKLGNSFTEYLIKSNKIKTMPLQFMRGKSIDDTFVILDEAQNTTVDQMKMFLTRIGRGSKFVINGDTNQSDLVNNRGIRVVSGLEDAIVRLRRIPEIGHIHFTVDDIVRHGITRKILECYEA